MPALRSLRLLAPLLLASLLTSCGGGFGGLNRSQREAIETVTQFVKGLAQVEATFSGVTDVQHLLGTLVGGALGSCPRIGVGTRSGRLAINFDYRGGCNPTALAGLPVQGLVAMGVDVPNLSGVVDFDRLSIAGQGITGNLAIRPENLRLNPMRLQINALDFEGLGTLNGTAHLVLGQGGRLSMREGDLTMSNLVGSRFAVTMTDLVVDPAQYGSAVPAAGRLVFPMPVQMLGIETVDIVVDFGERSARDGVVQVRVGPVGPFAYRLEHLRR
jgi:hypothetical protein